MYFHTTDNGVEMLVINSVQVITKYTHRYVVQHSIRMRFGIVTNYTYKVQSMVFPGLLGLYVQ